MSQQPSQSAPTSSPDRFRWFEEARFGLFLHWGPHAMLGSDVAERTLGHRRTEPFEIPVRDYARMAEEFNPRQFDAAAWAKLARAAGMRYVVLTAKHVDGFAMFDSQADGYNVVRHAAFKRDVLAELSEACRREDLTFCFYYCQDIDFHEPGADGNSWDYSPEGRDFTEFHERKVRPQVRELVTRYGPIGLIWFDVPCLISKAQSEALAALVHEFQPGCLVNSRIGNNAHDYTSAEDCLIPLGRYDGPWETAMTTNEHWFYEPHDEKWKSARTVVRNLVDIVSKGGNYLLNVGPTPEGNFPPAALHLLEDVGRWMGANGESIHGAGPAPIPRQTAAAWGRCTARGNRLYLHVLERPGTPDLFVPGLDAQKVSAWRLAGGPAARLAVSAAAHGARVELPRRAADWDAIDTVIVLEAASPAAFPRGAVVLPGAATTLPAYEAQISGPHARYADGVWEACVAIAPTWRDGANLFVTVPEHVRYGRIGCIVNWRSAGDRASWPLRVPAAGRYAVSLTYGAGPEAAGGEAVVRIGEHSLRGIVPPTPSAYEFRPLDLGVVAFDRDWSGTLEVAAGRLAGESLLNLQAVTLTPVG